MPRHPSSALGNKLLETVVIDAKKTAQRVREATRSPTGAAAAARGDALRRRGESGFALLLVCAMAGVIAIALYMEIPRVAFEAQRAKEELLIERGEQYARAIQVFVHQNGRYPQNLEELEGFNGRRSLRQRYTDPMTGKDEWRIIHIAAPGMFTDSLVNMPNDDKDKRERVTSQNGMGEGAGSGSMLATAEPQAVAPAGIGGAPGIVDPGHPQSQPSQGESVQPGRYSRGVPARTDVQPPDAPVNLPANQPGVQGPGAALSMQPGMNSSPAAQQPQGLAAYGGVAGVASMSTKKGIKIYNGHQKYNEWEFIYDVTKDRGIAPTGGLAR